MPGSVPGGYITPQKAAGLTTAANWIGNTCIGYFPPLLISAIGFRTFWVFGAFCILCFVAACRLPETRNRPLEEVANAAVAVKHV